MFFTRKARCPFGTVSMHGLDVQWAEETKYLGAVLQKLLRWTKHIKQRADLAKGAFAKLTPLMRRGIYLSSNNKMRIYKSIIRPQMLYAAPIWAYAGPAAVNRFQVIQNRALRSVVDAPWYVRNRQLHRDLNMTLIHDQAKEVATKFFIKLEESNDPQFGHIIDSYDERTSMKYLRPRCVTFNNP